MSFIYFRPFWLSPRQGIIVPVAPPFDDYAKKVTRRTYRKKNNPEIGINLRLGVLCIAMSMLRLKDLDVLSKPIFLFTFLLWQVQGEMQSAGFMVDVDLDTGTTMNKKIRNSQLAQYNFIFGKTCVTLLNKCIQYDNGTRKTGNLDLHFSRPRKHKIFAKKILKICFYSRNLAPTHEKVEVLKIWGCTRVVVGCSYNLLAFKANFEMRKNLTMQWSFCNRLHCICNCSLEDNINITRQKKPKNKNKKNHLKHKEFSFDRSVAIL